MGDEYINEVRSQYRSLAIYKTMNVLGLCLMFDNPGDCSLTLVREFHANLLTESKH